MCGDLHVALPELNSIQQQPILVNNALIFDDNTKYQQTLKNELNSLDTNYLKNFSSFGPIQNGDDEQQKSSISFTTSRIRYDPNGIPILDPIPQHSQSSTNSFQNVQKQQSTVRKIPQHVTLGDLDTDALLQQVKKSVDFAR